ncbi:MAG TPA: helix-turn-helix transcriptional regulator [Candidatus Stackebrandtia faecavium]|nr:helix-turn-helix transcriptional regulator [Candidatus Stackebrandtia faecavium]
MSVSTASMTEDRLVSVIDVARQRSAELSVADLADHAGYSPFHFSRMFSRQVGIGPGQYLTAMRIDRAKRLLLTQTESVIDVAMEVGFDSLSSFSRRFRSTVGIAPGQLRRLADRISDKPPQPVRLLSPGMNRVRVTVELPAGFSPRRDCATWVGWFPHPAPIGLPHSGLMVAGTTSVDLPLCDGAPYLLGFAVPAHADAMDQLAPTEPMVAVHPAPLATAGEVTLRFSSSASQRAMPLLSALPSLCRR